MATVKSRVSLLLELHLSFQHPPSVTCIVALSYHGTLEQGTLSVLSQLISWSQMTYRIYKRNCKKKIDGSREFNLNSDKISKLRCRNKCGWKREFMSRILLHQTLPCDSSSSFLSQIQMGSLDCDDDDGRRAASNSDGRQQPHYRSPP